VPRSLPPQAQAIVRDHVQTAPKGVMPAHNTDIRNSCAMSCDTTTPDSLHGPAAQSSTEMRCCAPILPPRQLNQAHPFSHLPSTSCPITILLTRLCVPIPTRRGSAAPSARHPRNPSREPVPRDATVPLPATHTNKQRRTSMIGYSCTVQLYGTRTDGTYCEYNTYRYSYGCIGFLQVCVPVRYYS
jgi:hypothetical protein